MSAHCFLFGVRHRGVTFCLNLLCTVDVQPEFVQSFLVHVCVQSIRLHECVQSFLMLALSSFFSVNSCACVLNFCCAQDGFSVNYICMLCCVFNASLYTVAKVLGQLPVKKKIYIYIYWLKI
jgi:hypothetical protein